MRRFVPVVSSCLALLMGAALWGACTVDRNGTKETSSSGGSGSGGAATSNGGTSMVGPGGSGAPGGAGGGIVDPPPAAVTNLALAINNADDPDLFAVGATWDPVPDLDVVDYLVVRSSLVPAILPQDGQIYAVGEPLGVATVVASGGQTMASDAAPRIGVNNRYTVWARDAAGQYGPLATAGIVTPIPPQRGRLRLQGFHDGNATSIATVLEQPRDFNVLAPPEGGDHRDIVLTLKNETARSVFAAKALFPSPGLVTAESNAITEPGFRPTAHFGADRMGVDVSREETVRFFTGDPDITIDFEIVPSPVIVAPSSNNEKQGNGDAELMLVDTSRTRRSAGGKAVDAPFGLRVGNGAYSTAVFTGGGGRVHATSGNDAIIRRFSTITSNGNVVQLDLDPGAGAAQATGLDWSSGVLRTVVTKGFSKADGNTNPSVVDIDLVEIDGNATPMVEIARYPLAAGITQIGVGSLFAGEAAFGQKYVVVGAVAGGRVMVFDVAANTTQVIDVSASCSHPRRAAINAAETQATVMCLVDPGLARIQRIDLVNASVLSTTDISSASPGYVQYLSGDELLITFRRGSASTIHLSGANNTINIWYGQSIWATPNRLGFLVARDGRVVQLGPDLNYLWETDVTFGEQHPFAISPY